jgi:diaminohydroxyphosphoribosylaminopyrimidine deaminase / 5-amino-6-(5-phosphoribosylamino)uracil reductase
MFAIFDFCPMNAEHYMQRCIRLARMGSGCVAPNPMVGAVLVHGGKIIGEGFHKAYGGPHAEVECIRSVSPEHEPLIAASTLYVSLEPCAHFGKTPPCTDLILQKHIPSVVIGSSDPFVLVAGKGVAKLKAAGVSVTTAVLEKECRQLNRQFFTFHTKGRPYITLKWAQTADGKIASDHLKRAYISTEYTNRVVHRWRSAHMSILVGTNTALLDDPSLTTRLWPGKNALRLVIDKTLRLPAALQLFDGEHSTIVFNHIRQSEHFNLTYERVVPGTSLVQQVLQSLHRRNIQSLMVEGGAQLLQSFIDEGLWDEARVITNESLSFRSGLAAPFLKQHQLVKQERIDNDTLHFYAHADNEFLITPEAGPRD